MFIVSLIAAVVGLLTRFATLDGDSSTAGATPAAEGATPSQSQPASTPASTPAPPTATPSTSTTPATGAQTAQPTGATLEELAALGDPGKRALDRMKQERDSVSTERDALQRRVAELENASKSDQDKAIDTARQEGEKASDARWAGIVRSLRIEGALRDAGCIAPDVAAASPALAKLEVDGSDGQVKGLVEAIDQFKESHPSLFGAPGQARPATGDFGNGHRGGQQLPKEPDSLEAAVEQHYAQTPRR